MREEAEFRNGRQHTVGFKPSARGKRSPKMSADAEARSEHRVCRDAKPAASKIALAAALHVDDSMSGESHREAAGMEMGVRTVEGR